MNWEYPNVLYALWILPLAAFLLVRAQRRRRETARRFADEAMARRLVPFLSPTRAWIRGALLLVGIGFLVTAGARPRFGEYYEKVTQRGLDLFVLLDVSRSMEADDMKPSRLKRACLDIEDLLGRLPGDRTGLIVFAGKPVVKVPLTTDRGFFLDMLDRIGPHSAPLGGTLIGDAVRLALAGLEERRDRDQVIVLITDGEDHASYPLEAAGKAQERGVRIFTMAIGSTGEGTRIRLRDETGNLTYLKHEGQEIWSVADISLLRDMAQATSPPDLPVPFLHARPGKDYNLGRFFMDHQEKLKRAEIREDRRQRLKQRFQIFIVLGLAFFLAGLFIAPCNGRETRGGLDRAVSPANEGGA